MFKKIKTDEFQLSPFKLIGKDWMLITAEKDKKINTMTASWGGLGVMWHKDVAYIVIRPQRYTKEFIENSSSFSLTFFENSYKDTLSYLGTVSGRDENKIENAKLTTIYEDGIPYFEESNVAIFCNKLYAQKFQKECFIDKSIDEKVYANLDYHTLYIGEIKKILVKK